MAPPRREVRVPHFRSPRLAVQAASLLLLLGLVQLGGSIAFYQAIDRQTLREDHARRIAELLVVSDRLHRLDARRTAGVMSTRHLDARVDAVPAVPRMGQGRTLQLIAGQVVHWEPGLATRPLHLAFADKRGGGRDLVGSIRLADGQWLNFRSRDFGAMWPIALRATILTFFTALACLAVGLLLLRLLTRPLRRLALAADAIGHGQRVEIDERGPEDLQNLAHAMNVMQERIARLLEDQARSFEAISHDLRTPLARQRVAVDLIDDREISEIVAGSIDEMEGLLASLQGYLRAQHLASEAEAVDLAALTGALAAPYAGRVHVLGPETAIATTYAEPVRLALAALVENAVRYGGEADVRIGRMSGAWEIEVEDSGPGIPAAHFEDVLTPFFRLDEARSRDTPGFGLGIPTAHRLMMRFGGKLSFVERAEGGLRATLTIPEA